MKSNLLFSAIALTEWSFPPDSPDVHPIDTLAYDTHPDRLENLTAQWAMMRVRD